MEIVMQLRRRTNGLTSQRVVFSTLLIILSVWTTANWGQPPANVQNVFLPAPRELKQHLTRASRAIEDQEFGEAVLHLGQLLTSDALNQPLGPGGEPQDFFISLEGTSGTQVSLKAEAQRLLASMPARGRELYELQYGADGRTLLEAAIETADAEKLTEVTRKFFHTRAGYEASILLGHREMDHGRPLAAAMCFQRVADAGPASQPFEPQLSMLLATCWLRAGLPSAAEERLADLQQRHPNLKIQAAGEEVSLFAAGSTPLERLQEMTGIRASLEQGIELQWTLHRGNPGRTGSMPGGMPLRSLWWEVLTANDASDERLIEQLRQKDRDRGLTSISHLQPLVVNDVVLMRSPDRLLAVNFENGKRIWEFPWFDLPEEEVAEQVPNSSQRGTQQNRSQQLRQRLWEDAAFGELSSDGKRVFVLWDMSYANDNPRARMMMVAPGGLATSRPGQPKSHNQLAALDMESEGSLLWVVGGESGEDDPRLAGAFFLGPPLPLYGQLYCLVEFKGEIRLVVLDATNGQFQWSQQLAHVDARTIQLDRVRRLAGASPSFADGVLLCPTSAGAVVAVDVTTRSLLWGYQYNNRRIFNPRVGIPVAPGDMADDNWLDATITIAGDSVIITPIEGDELICLELLTGQLRWKPQKRNAGLYIACIHNQAAVIVSSESLYAIKVADGTPAWEAPLILDGEVPTGRGFYSKGHYFLPTSASRLLRIDMASGKLLASLQTSEPLGNLVCYKNQLLSQTPHSLRSFFQVELLRTDVDQRLAANENDIWALTRQSELLLQDNKRVEALQILRRSLMIEPEDVGLRGLMVETALELLREDFVAHRDLIDEVEPLLDHPVQRQAYLELLARGRQASGDMVSAFDTYMMLIDSLARPRDVEIDSRSDLQQVEPQLRVRRDRWIQVQLAGLLAKASETEQATIDKRILDRYGLALESGRPQPIRDFLSYFGRHDSATNARMELASRLIQSNQVIERELLEAELLLNSIGGSGNAALQAEALARLALLLHKANRRSEAAYTYQQLADRFGDTVVLESDTGKDLLAEAQQDPALAEYFTPIPWAGGRVALTPPANNRGQFPSFQRIYRMPLLELRGSLPPTTMVALDQTRNALVVRDSFGATLQRVSMNDGRRPVSSAQYGITYARANGHLLLLSLGREIVAVDTLRNSQDPSEAILWRKQTIADTNIDPRFSTRSLRTSSRLTPLGGRHYVAIDANNRRIGVTGSLTLNGVCFIRLKQLVAVDLINGNEIWVRDGVEPGSHIYSNESRVVLVPPNSDGVIQVFDAIDGTLIEQRPRPANETPWHQLGTASIDYQLEGEHLHLLKRDQLTGEQAWKLTVPVGTRGQLVQRDELMLLQQDGTLQLVDLRTGVSRWTSRCEAVPQLTSIHVTRSQDRYQIITNRSENSSGISIPSIGMQAQLVFGKIYSVDANTGKQRWQAPATVEGWALPLYQPADSPVLVFLRQLNPRVAPNGARGSIRSEFFCLDSRDGRLLMAPRSVSGYIRSFDVICSPRQQTATVIVNGEAHIFRLTDEDLPPAAPVQMTLTSAISAAAIPIAGKAAQGNGIQAKQAIIRPLGRPVPLKIRPGAPAKPAVPQPKKPAVPQPKKPAAPPPPKK
jgi:outer membrane protein assembly factor BamB